MGIERERMLARAVQQAKILIGQAPDSKDMKEYCDKINEAFAVLNLMTFEAERALRDIDVVE